MEKPKAYKLLAQQEGISNSEAKSLIDRGLVYVGNSKVMIARGEISPKTTFIVQKVEKAHPIYEDDNMIVIDKPAFVNSDEIERQFKGSQLLHRLDRETSGVLMLVKNEEFRLKAISEFKKDNVYKEYVAWVDGIVSEPFVVDQPLITEKKGNKAVTKVAKGGKPAITEVTPLEVSGKKTKVQLIIHHGRTHQIRAHLKYAQCPIVGDESYGGRPSKRVMLHAKKVTILGLTFIAPEPKVFGHFGS
jgi:23S rRNA pseudouridine1911/1915/1917 synthase